MKHNLPDDYCWSFELQPIAGLVFDEEMCDYWMDKESFLEQLDIFILNIMKQSELLHKMMAENNISDMKKLLHKLKGSAKLYGAKRLSESIKKFEDVLKTDISTGLLDVEAEFDNAVQEITSGLVH